MRINVAIIILFETKTSVQWLMDGSVINPPLKNWEGVWCVKYVTAYHRRNDILRQRGEEIRKRYLLPVYSKMPFCLWLLCDNSVHTIYFCCRRSFLFANSTPNKCGVSVSRWLRTGKFYPILASYCHLLSRRRTFQHVRVRRAFNVVHSCEVRLFGIWIRKKYGHSHADRLH